MKFYNFHYALFYYGMPISDLKDEYMEAVDWHKCKHMKELDISCTDLSENTIMELLTKLPSLSFLSVAHCDFFTDKVR